MDQNHEQKPVPEPVPEDYGKLYPRTFEECPVCHTKARFAAECFKENFTAEELAKHEPYLHVVRATYDKGIYQYQVINLVDTCAKCGVMYTVARDKKTVLLATIAAPGSGPRGQAFGPPFRFGRG
jgi:hypothetical protein